MGFVTAWGLLPIALPLSCVTMLGLGALAFPHDSVPFGEIREEVRHAHEY